VLRDIHFVILPATVTDAKRKLSQERGVSRLNAFREFTSALQLVSDDPPELDLPSQGFVKVVSYVQPGERPIRLSSWSARRGSWAMRRVSAV
jgi:hypothetical protein